jgi:hypothetical protein
MGTCSRAVQRFHWLFWRGAGRALGAKRSSIELNGSFSLALVLSDSLPLVTNCFATEDTYRGGPGRLNPKANHRADILIVSTVELERLATCHAD